MRREDFRAFSSPIVFSVPGVDQIVGSVFFNRFHEIVCDGHGNIEIVQFVVVLFAVDEFHDVGMVHPQNAPYWPPSGFRPVSPARWRY